MNCASESAENGAAAEGTDTGKRQLKKLLRLVSDQTPFVVLGS